MNTGKTEILTSRITFRYENMSFFPSSSNLREGEKKKEKILLKVFILKKSCFRGFADIPLLKNNQLIFNQVVFREKIQIN